MDLDALRARIAEILERLAGEGIKSLTDEDLSAAQDELKNCFDDARALGGQDGLAEATRAHDAIVQVREETATRAAEAERIAAEFDRLTEELAEPEPEPDPEPVAADEPEVEVVDDDPEPVVVVDEPEPAVVEVVEPAPVAPAPALVPASAGQAVTVASPAPSRGPSIARAAAQRRPSGGPAVPKGRPLSVKFSFSDDGRLTPRSRRDVAEHLADTHHRWSRTTGMTMNIPVLHAEWDYPEERDLRPIEQSPMDVTRRFDEVMGHQALTAAGGICAPFPVDYGLLNVSSDVRPVAAALPSFQATRGGIQFMPSYTLSDITADAASGSGAAIGKITKAQDAAGSPAKPCQTFTCKSVTSCEVYAVTRCVTFGNWNARFYPELVDNIMAQVQAVQARFAEELLLSAICTGSTKVDFNGVQYAGALPSLLAAVGRAAARLRGSNRAPDASIRVAFPSWVRDLVREDLSVRLANGNEQFAMADAWWDARLAERGVSAWYFIDGQNDIQELKAAITEGPLPAWPTHVVFYVYFEGAWTFLDGGTLDLGIVRDSVLNPANNFQMFAETWEGICNRGLPSLCVNARLCANGGSAGTFPPEPCAS